MITRIELIVRQLTKQHAPHLLTQTGGDLRTLAAGLARHGVLVLYFKLPSASQADREQLINNRVSAFANLYTLLTEALFPTFTYVKAHDADREDPPVVIFEGRSAPVIQLFADVLVPFIAVTQSQRLISDAELRTVMTVLLEELEGQDLPLAQYNAVLREGIVWIRKLLNIPGEQYSLTRFHHSSFLHLPEPPLPPPETPESAMEKYQTVYQPPEIETRGTQEQKPVVNDKPQFIPPDTLSHRTTEAMPVVSSVDRPKMPPQAKLPDHETEKPSISSERKRSTMPIFYRRNSNEKKSRRAPVPPPVPKRDED